MKSLVETFIYLLGSLVGYLITILALCFTIGILLILISAIVSPFICAYWAVHALHWF